MDPLTISSIAAPVLGGIVGGIFSSNGAEERAAAAQKALEQLNALGLPPDTSKALILQQFQSAGVLTPELQQDISLAASNVGQIKEDQSLRNAQLESVNMLSN